MAEIQLSSLSDMIEESIFNEKESFGEDQRLNRPDLRMNKNNYIIGK